MDSNKAQTYINSLLRFNPSPSDIEAVNHLKVDYQSLDDMPAYRRERIECAVKHIVDKYNPRTIHLVRSMLDGYPVDERTSPEDFKLLQKVKQRCKMSDYDFIVPTIESWQVQEQIAPLIKIDMFKHHHNDVRQLEVYKKNS